MASFKLSSTDRRKLKKEFGERGYKVFLWLNRINWYDNLSPLETEITRLQLKQFKDYEGTNYNSGHRQ